MRDLITVTDLQLRTSALQADHWQREAKEQPLVLTLEIETDVDQEATQDNLLQDSLNYGTVTRKIEQYIDQLQSPAKVEGEESGIPLEELAEQLVKVILFQASAPNVRLELRRPRALLTADSIGVTLTRSRSDYSPNRPPPTSSDPSALPLSTYTLNPSSHPLHNDRFFVRGLRKYIIIGLNPSERLDEQEVIVDLEFYANEMNLRLANGARSEWRDWRKVVKGLEAHLSTSAPLTIELITTSLAKMITVPPTSTNPPPRWDVPRATVRLSKPVALQFAKHPSVQVTRSRSDFYHPSLARAFSTTAVRSQARHTAYLGIGTNIGERVGNLSDALKKLEELGKDGNVKVVDTSFLYESEAMYHEEQDKFLNAALKIETSLEPLALLNLLKSVESNLGRDFSTFRNGPRIIDLDLLLYDDIVYDSASEEGGEEGKGDRWLKVPHQSIQEREFVLRPLLDIAPTLRHPKLDSTLSDLFASLSRSTPSTVHRVFPLSRSTVHPFTRSNSFPCAPTPDRTLLMSIVNTTPDSFSDGGLNFSLDAATSSSLSHISSGADVIDIGGMSTRPGADDVEPREEIDRVVPLIRALRSPSTTASSRPIISIDTFRAEVARAAIDAGADIINDVHGGREEGMLDVVKELGVPIVLMHSRGDSRTMTKLTDYESLGGVVEGVRREMEEMVEKAIREKGIPRWNIILDPGIGFAKTSQQNYTLLRNLDRLFEESLTLKEFPVLIGLSRKKFLGPSIDAKDRVWGTSAGVTAGIASGRCEIARVHDTKEMKQVVEVADSIYRNRQIDE